MVDQASRSSVLGRRRFVRSAALGGVLIAGCSTRDDDEEPDEPDDVDPGLRLNGEALHSGFPLELVDPGSGALQVSVHWHGEFSHWHFGPLEVPRGDTRTVEAVFNDRDQEPIPLGPDETHRLSIRRTEDTEAELLDVAVDGATVDLHGGSGGDGELLFQLERAGETAWMSPPLPVVVA